MSVLNYWKGMLCYLLCITKTTYTRTYLHNAQFEIFCDYQPLKHLLGSTMMNKRVQIWALIIQGYNAEIKYIKGASNSDMLSRLPGSNDDQEP